MLKIESWFYSEKLDHFIKLIQSLKINICKCDLEKLSKYLLSLYHYLHQNVNNNYENYESLAPTAIVFLRGRTKNLKCINRLCDIKQHNKKSFRFKSKTFFLHFTSIFILLIRRKATEVRYIGQAITPTCFRRCQDIAVRWKLFIWFFNFIEI